MAGSLCKRSENSWQLRIHLGLDPITRRKRYLERTFRGTRREAERELARLVAENDGFVPRRDHESTVAKLLEKWLEFASPSLSPRTAMVEGGYVKSVIAPMIGHLQISKVTSLDLDRFYRHLVDVGGPKGPYSPASIVRVHGIMRRAFAQGVRWGWIRQNPAREASPPRDTTPRQFVPPTPDQVAQLLAEAKRRDSQMATLLRLAVSTGARRGELLALRWRHFDLGKGTVTIQRGIVLANGELVEQGTKTHQTRTITLDISTLQTLAEHRKRKFDLLEQVGADSLEDRFVFSELPDCSRPMRPDSTSRAFRALCAKAGIANVRFHDLRHYVATRLLTSGVDPRTVAGRLGHRKPSTTLDVYAHFVPEADQWAADLLASLLDKAISDEGGDRIGDSPHTVDR